MSEPPRAAPEPEPEPVEEVTDAVVLAEVRPIEPARPPGLPAAAAAATGFVAGAAIFAFLRRRRLARRRRKLRRPADLLTVVASRSFLIDVHLLDRE